MNDRTIKTLMILVLITFLVMAFTQTQADNFETVSVEDALYVNEECPLMYGVLFDYYVVYCIASEKISR